MPHSVNVNDAKPEGGEASRNASKIFSCLASSAKWADVRHSTEDGWKAMQLGRNNNQCRNEVRDCCLESSNAERLGH